MDGTITKAPQSWLRSKNVERWLEELRALTDRDLTAESLYWEIWTAYYKLRIARKSFENVVDSLESNTPRSGDPLLAEIANFICGEQRYQLVQKKPHREQDPKPTGPKTRKLKSAPLLPWHHEWMEGGDEFVLRVYNDAHCPAINLLRNGKRIGSVSYNTKRASDLRYFDEEFNKQRLLGKLREWFDELRDKLAQS